jgi:dCTP deaminase
MSVLSDRALREAIESGVIGIDPYDPDLIQPASIDIRLSNSFRVFHNHRVSAIDLRHPPTNLTEEVVVTEDEPFIIHPGEFCLGATLEVVHIPNHLVCIVNGKSSIGRLGLIVHATAGWLDSGFIGDVTLELANLTRVPIKLYAGLAIGQLIFESLDQEVEKPYGHPDLGSHYQGQRGATASRYLNTDARHSPPQEP